MTPPPSSTEIRAPGRPLEHRQDGERMCHFVADNSQITAER